MKLPLRLARSTEVRATPLTWMALLAAGLGAPGLAGAAAPTADLSVQIEAPAAVEIARATSYLVTVTNLGNQTSGTITASVSFPLTSTSPQVFTLGQVSGLDSRCSFANNKITCSLAGLRKGWSTTFAYTYTAPVSTQTLRMTATASSSTTDPVAGNNTASVVPNLVYPARPISASPISTRLCTGTTLTSFFECTKFPSSIVSFSAMLNSDRTISVSNAQPLGTWSQNQAKTSLKMEFYDYSGSVPVKTGEFNGWAIHDSNCFQGLTTRTTSSYVSPYEVCLP